MMVRMRDWVIPLGVGCGLGLATLFGGDALGWSRGAIGVGVLIAGAIGAALRVAFHDYDSELEEARRTGRPI